MHKAALTPGAPAHPERAHLIHALKTCPPQAFDALKPWPTLAGEDPLERIESFWVSLARAMGAWLLPHPEWGGILQGWIASSAASATPTINSTPT